MSVEDLIHYGIPRRSGRYPWGSGKKPYQNETLYNKKEIAKGNINKNAQFGKKDKMIKRFNSKNYEDLSHDRIIEKGSVGYRISDKKNETDKGPTFISFDSSDRDEWKSSISEYKERMGSKEKYMMHMGYGKVKDTIISNPSMALTSFYVSILKDTRNNVGNLGKKIHEKLKNEGYNGVPDLNDFSSGYFKNAVYLFDKNSLTESDKWEYWNDDVWSLKSGKDNKYSVKYLD